MPGVALLALAAVLVVAGCSSGGGTKVSAAASTTTTPAGGGSNSQAFQAYRACLQQHGVTLPSGGRRSGDTATPPPSSTGSAPPDAQRPPVSLPAGVTQAQMDAAQSACASLRPAGGFGGGGGNNPARLTALKAYASCLSDHGVTITTTPTTNGRQSRPQFDRNDPHFAAADQACAALRPQFGGPGGAPPSTTSTTAAGQP